MKAYIEGKKLIIEMEDEDFPPNIPREAMMELLQRGGECGNGQSCSSC